MQKYILVACLLVNFLAIRFLDSSLLGLLLSSLLLGFGIAWSKTREKSPKAVLEYIGVAFVVWFALTFGTKRSQGIAGSVAGSSSIQLEMALGIGLIFFALIAGFSFLSGQILNHPGSEAAEDRQTPNEEDD